jgi:hypothetical protein
MHDAAKLYARYAVALLLLTLLAGVYLRAALVWPGVRGGMSVPYMVHAHSHAGFFGWAVMAACAAIVARCGATGAAAIMHRLLAHAIGIGSVAAFVGFALRGYDTATIALSALHVLLWAVFAAVVWPALATTAAPARALLRGGIAFLVLAGLMTIAPVMMMVRGVSDPWLLQVGVKLFLTPFVSGFLVLVALGIIAARMPRFRATSALALIAIGVLPSTLLYVSAPPPLPWLLLPGRAGMGLVGAGLLLFAMEALRLQRTRRTLPPLAALATISALLAGVLYLLAAAGVGAAFMHNRNITVAVLHLVLLGVVTPSFVLALRPALRAPVRTVAYAGALALMLAPLAVSGWPWAARRVIALGVPLEALFTLAAIGGAAAALALAALFMGETDGTEGRAGVPRAASPRQYPEPAAAGHGPRAATAGN